MNRHLNLAVLGLLLAPASAAAAELIPVFKLDMMGGQFFFEETNTSFSGNADYLVSPAVKLSEELSIVPTLAGQYRRTREVRELIGGGFLTQESFANTFHLKAVRSLSERWSVKPNLSFRNELIVETEDERLGAGLFDYNKLAFGVEFERKGESLKSLRQGFSAYGVRFYHYDALASEASELGEEVNSGNQVLDFDAYDYSASADWMPGSRTLLSLAGLLSYRPFRDQNLVTESGEYELKGRKDLYAAVQAGVQQGLPTWSTRWFDVQSVAGLNLAWSVLDSNQHNYDAASLRFNPEYYDYGELAVGPFFAFKFNDEGPALTVAYDYTRRDFWGRLAQEADGAYLSERVNLGTHTAALQLSWPLAYRLSFKLQGTYRFAGSNMKYEQSYRYNYSSAHYFVGFGYSL